MTASGVSAGGGNGDNNAAERPEVVLIQRAVARLMVPDYEALAALDSLAVALEAAEKEREQRERIIREAWRANTEELRVEYGRELAAAEARAAAATEALRHIAGHTVISEGEFQDDNCDWHCTAELVAIAKAALAATGAQQEPPPPRQTVVGEFTEGGGFIADASVAVEDAQSRDTT